MPRALRPARGPQTPCSIRIALQRFAPLGRSSGSVRLAWSREDLAKQSGVSYPSIARLESSDSEIRGRAQTAAKIVFALEAAGIIFVAETGEGVGVRLRKAKPTIQSSGLAKRAERVRKRAELVFEHLLERVEASESEKVRRKNKLTTVPKDLTAGR